MYNEAVKGNFVIIASDAKSAVLVLREELALTHLEEVDFLRICFMLLFQFFFFTSFLRFYRRWEDGDREHQDAQGGPSGRYPGITRPRKYSIECMERCSEAKMSWMPPGGWLQCQSKKCLLLSVDTSFFVFPPVQKLKMEIDSVMADILSFESTEEKWVLVGGNHCTCLNICIYI